MIGRVRIGGGSLLSRTVRALSRTCVKTSQGVRWSGSTVCRGFSSEFSARAHVSPIPPTSDLLIPTLINARKDGDNGRRLLQPTNLVCLLSGQLEAANAKLAAVEAKLEMVEKEKAEEAAEAAATISALTKEHDYRVLVGLDAPEAKRRIEEQGKSEAEQYEENRRERRDKYNFISMEETRSKLKNGVYSYLTNLVTDPQFRPITIEPQTLIHFLYKVGGVKTLLPANDNLAKALNVNEGDNHRWKVAQYMALEVFSRLLEREGMNIEAVLLGGPKPCDGFLRHGDADEGVLNVDGAKVPWSRIEVKSAISAKDKSTGGRRVIYSNIKDEKHDVLLLVLFTEEEVRVYVDPREAPTKGVGTDGYNVYFRANAKEMEDSYAIEKKHDEECILLCACKYDS